MQIESDVVRLEQVKKVYPDHHVKALCEVSLSVEHGQFVAIMGPSGCGKSTLLNLIGCMESPSAGRISINNVDTTNLPDEHLTRLRAEQIGFVFQFFNLLPTLTVRENVELPLILLKKGNNALFRQRTQQVLERVGISQRADFFPAQLSGGELQRAAIARAIIHEPNLVIADEPTGNLDSETGQSILGLLKEMNQTLGITIIMATHSAEAAHWASSVLHMKDGRLISQAPTEC